MGLVQSDAFNKSLLGPGSSSLASEGVVFRSVGSFGGKTSQAPLVVESSFSAARQEFHRSLELLCFMLRSYQTTCLQDWLFKGGCKGHHFIF